ncbi:MAG: nitronate monooxygenase [Gammaproteobacteria bacterium]|nr:nitronate monooxygenase [Gammaproteobacteria bacterium]
MMLGAEGAWVGSAFLASDESGILDFQKQAIVEAAEDGTVISRTVTGKPARIIRSLWTEAWASAGLEPLPMPYQGVVAGPVMAAANRAGRGDINPGFAGQGIGVVRAVRPAAEILEEIAFGTEQALKRSSNLHR